MARKTVVALYDDFSTASEVVRELTDRGFRRDDISLMASDARGEYGRYLGADRETMEGEEVSGAATGAGVGAGIGAVVGGLGGILVGLGALVIPGVGPILAAGPLAAALSGLAGAGMGAVAGGVAGGLIGALVDLGVPEDQAHYYAEGVRRGGTLVTVQTDEHMADKAVDIMNRYNPVDINERARRWQEIGWTRFDEAAEPYTAEEIERERERERAYYGGTGYREGDYGERGFRQDEFGAEMGYQEDDYEVYDTRFRQHYETSLATTQYPYDYYQPAYRYGYNLASDERYADRGWNEIEPEVRREWERDRPGTWEEFKGSVRHAWEEVKDAFR